MSSGAYHRQAEALLQNAEALRHVAKLSTPEGRGLLQSSEKIEAEAELDLKAAHVHAMLAVAAATAGGRESMAYDRGADAGKTAHLTAYGWTDVLRDDESPSAT